MTGPWQSNTDRGFSYDSVSDASPLTPRGRDVVPVGTVASRIMEIQKLAESSKSDGSRSPTTRHQEQSRAGFGRRDEPRFGQPASRSSKPDEGILVEPKHSFLGLNTQRGNHAEDHAMVDGRAKWDRTTDLHRQLQSSGQGARVQYEATSPERILPTGESPKISQEDYNRQVIDAIANIITENQPSTMAPPIPPLPSASHHSAEEMSVIHERSNKPVPQKSGRHTATGQRKTPCEWLSVETTSSMRRQSVRDLYYHYGIQRPAGLVSSENVVVNPELTLQPLVEYRCCHICGLPSSLDVLKCSCGHSYCGDCECLPPGTIVTSGDSVECIESVLKREDRPLKETKAKKHSSDREISTQAVLGQQTARPKSKQQLTREEVRQRETPTSHRSRSREQQFSTPVTFPDLRLEEVICSHGSRGTRPRHTTLHDSSSVIRQATVSSETVKPARGPPVPTADALLPIYPLSALHSGMQLSQVESQNVPHSDCHRKEDYHYRSSHSSSSPNLGQGSSSDSCHSSGCHATHQGHRPYRHSITCTRKRRRYPEETDSGYVAGASHLEELGPVQPLAEPQRRCGTQLNGHKKQGKQQLCSYQTESSSLREKTDVHSVNNLTRQKSYEEHEAKLHAGLNHLAGAQHSQEPSLPQENIGDSFNLSASLCPAESHSNVPLRRWNDSGSILSSSDCSAKCRHCVDGDLDQYSAAGRSKSHGYVNGGNTPTPPRNAVISDASLTSIATSPRPPATIYQVESSDTVEQSLNPVSVPNPHIEMKSLGWLADGTVILLQVGNRQETSTRQSNQSRPDVLMLPSRKYDHEDPMEIASQPNRNIHQSQSKHSNDNCTEANLQDFRNTMTAVAITAVEENHRECGTNFNEALTTDTSPYLSSQPLGELSPVKSQPVSRRLSAFFKLQEQNIVSLLNKRLQQHQNELKRLDRMSNDKPKVAVCKMSLNQEQDRQVNKLEGEFEERDSESKYDDDRSSLTLQVGERDKAFGTGSRDEMQDTASGSALSNMEKEQLAEDHDCNWNRMASKKQELPGPQVSAKNGKEEASEIGIKGITIVIHLKGREDVVIRTDLSQGI